MEPSSLKDYLEALLAERSDRLMGGSIKHFGSDLCPSDLCYKEVLPANHMPQPQQPQQPQTGSSPKAGCAKQNPAMAMPQKSCASQQPAAAPTYQSCTAEAYQNYAFNALKNLANMFNNAESPAASMQNAAPCAEMTPSSVCAEQAAVQQMEETAAMMPAQSSPTACQPMMMTSETEVMQPMEVMQVNLLISQQLERMEHMLREMYITNQELFKSIIMYCREHTED